MRLSSGEPDECYNLFPPAFRIDGAPIQRIVVPLLAWRPHHRRIAWKRFPEAPSRARPGSTRWLETPDPATSIFWIAAVPVLDRGDARKADDYQWLANFGFQASGMLRAAFFGVSAAGQSTPYHRTGALAARRAQPQIGALSRTRGQSNNPGRRSRESQPAQLQLMQQRLGIRESFRSLHARRHRGPPVFGRYFMRLLSGSPAYPDIRSSHPPPN